MAKADRIAKLRAKLIEQGIDALFVSAPAEDIHHTLGATLVEVRGKKFHLRQLNGLRDTGEFQDLTTLYRSDGIVPSPVAALVMGDTHVDCIDPKVLRATFGAGGMIETLKPGVLAWHDLLDGEAVNPHHEGNPFIAVAKRAGQLDVAEDEVRRADPP